MKKCFFDPKNQNPEKIAEDINTPEDSKILGGQNQPRPIEGDTHNIYIAPSKHRQH